MTSAISTDWDSYYDRPYKTSSLTRKLMGALLSKRMGTYCRNSAPSVIEIGGGNSCFFEKLWSDLNPSHYKVLDLNEVGLKKFVQARGMHRNVSCSKEDILNPVSDEKADIVFSVGLIEHFSPELTKVAFLNHFRFAKPGSTVIVTFPTPTLLYRVTRRLSEALGMWIFFDERPILVKEIIDILPSNVTLEEVQIVWPMVLTQAILTMTVK